MVLRFTEQSKNKYFSFALAYMVSFLCLLNTINSTIGLIGISSSLDTVFLYTSFWAVILVGLILVLLRAKNMPIDIFLIAGGIIIAYVISYLYFPENSMYMRFNHLYYVGNPIYALFIFSLPAYAFVRQLTDYTYFKKYMTVFSYLVVILSVITFFFARETSAAGYMTLSYNMLFQLFFLIVTKSNHKVLRFIVVSLGVFVLMFGGSRGAAISLLIGVFIHVLFNKTNSKRKIISLIYIAFLIFFFLFFAKEIMALISILLKFLNIESRTFDMIVSLEFFNESGRDVIREKIFSNISLFGEGLYADRAILGGGYSHNIVLEIILQFGIIVGPILIALICFAIFKGLRRKNSPEWSIIIASLPSGLISLMFSGSYLYIAPCFYMLLGLCTNSLENKTEQ